jgi:hypothetical protein
MQRPHTGMQFVIPDLLTQLLADGIWPSDSKAEMSQNLRSLVPPDRVRLFAADEDTICFQAPPFRTIAHYVASGRSADFWPKFGALEQIVPSEALVIGDFGLGSDASIILNYARSASQPPVWRLRWGPATQTAWVQGAASFEEFIALLGLTGGVA